MWPLPIPITSPPPLSSPTLEGAPQLPAASGRADISNWLSLSQVFRLQGLLGKGEASVQFPKWEVAAPPTKTHRRGFRNAQSRASAVKQKHRACVLPTQSQSPFCNLPTIVAPSDLLRKHLAIADVLFQSPVRHLWLQRGSWAPAPQLRPLSHPRSSALGGLRPPRPLWCLVGTEPANIP